MRLELRWSEVDTLIAGSATRLAGRRLEVDLEALTADTASASAGQSPLNARETGR